MAPVLSFFRSGNKPRESERAPAEVLCELQENVLINTNEGSIASSKVREARSILLLFLSHDKNNSLFCTHFENVSLRILCLLVFHDTSKIVYLIMPELHDHNLRFHSYEWLVRRKRMARSRYFENSYSPFPSGSTRILWWNTWHMPCCTDGTTSVPFSCTTTSIVTIADSNCCPLVQGAFTCEHPKLIALSNWLFLVLFGQ